MKKTNQVMVVLAIALTLVLVTANLHHLKKTARPVPGSAWTEPANGPGLTFHIGLLPEVSINVFVNNQ